MGAFEIVGGIILLLVAVVIIVAVTLQESKGGGLGALGGGDSSSFYDKNRGRTKDAMLVRASGISGIIMAVVALAVLFVTK